jgi:probable HAF family extracellular repeat protein
MGSFTVNIRHCLALAFISLIFPLAGTVAAGPIQFQLTDLGVLTGQPLSYATSINNAGQVVGYSEQGSGHPTAFIYSNGQLSDISGTAGFQFQHAYSINNSGQVVGFGNTPNGGVNQALLYSGGTIQDLGAIVGGAVSQARGINDSGLITGISVKGGANTDAFIYKSNTGTITSILPAYQNITYPNAINSSGQVVGSTNGFEVTPFLYSNGKVTDLPSFGGVGGSANGINNAGQVVGYSDIASGNGLDGHAFLWNNGVMTDLGTFGAGASEANAINNNGWIVGDTSSSNNAWLYMNGQSVNLASVTLNATGWQLESATGINDAGQIIGYGEYQNGQTRAFLLTLVPEPSAWLLFAIGTLAVVTIARLRVVTDRKMSGT